MMHYLKLRQMTQKDRAPGRVLHLPLVVALPLIVGLMTLSVSTLTLGLLYEGLSGAEAPVDQVHIANEFSGAWRMAIYGAAAAALCGCVLGWAIVRPVRQLANQLEAMAESGRSSMISLNGVSELAFLGEAYNRLVSSTSKYLPERARYIFHNVASGVIAYGADGKIDTINAATDEMLELSGRGVGGRTVREALDSAGLMDELIAVLEEPLHNPGCAISREITITTLSGTRKTLGVSVASVGSPLGHEQDIVATLMDLSLLKEISSKMLQEQKLAAVGSLAAGVAHEIRNPLCSLKALAQLLREGPISGDKQIAYLDVIVSEVDRLNGVVSRLLDFANPRQEPEEQLELEPLVANVLTLAHHQALRKSIALESRVPPGIYVQGRRGPLVQALLNVVLNGAEAAPESGRVEVVVRPGERPTLEIGNNGPAIPESELDTIFDPYHTTKDYGIGLGLAITSQIIAQHKGLIRAENRADGVCFIIELPQPTIEETLEPALKES